MKRSPLVLACVFIAAISSVASAQVPEPTLPFRFGNVSIHGHVVEVSELTPTYVSVTENYTVAVPSKIEEIVQEQLPDGTSVNKTVITEIFKEESRTREVRVPVTKIIGANYPLEQVVFSNKLGTVIPDSAKLRAALANGRPAILLPYEPHQLQPRNLPEYLKAYLPFLSDNIVIVHIPSAHQASNAAPAADAFPVVEADPFMENDEDPAPAPVEAPVAPPVTGDFPF